MKDVLSANDAIAAANRERFDRAGTFVLNLMSARTGQGVDEWCA